MVIVADNNAMRCTSRRNIMVENSIAWCHFYLKVVQMVAGHCTRSNAIVGNTHDHLNKCLTDLLT